MTRARHDGLANDVTGLGDDQIDSRLRTIRTYCGRRSVAEYVEEYRQNWMANRGIQQPAGDMYRAGFDVSADGVAPEDIQRLLGYSLTIGEDGSLTQDPGLLWHAWWLEWVGNVAGGAALWPIVDDGLDPAEPLDLRRIRSVDSWIVLDRSEISPYLADRGANVEPEFYYLSDMMSAGPESEDILQPGTVIHRSRLWLNKGRRMPRSTERNQDWWGDSTLELTWRERRSAEEGSEYLRSYAQRASWLAVGIGELNELLQAKDDDGNPIGPDALRKMFQEKRRMLSTLGFFLYDTGREGTTHRDGGRTGGRPSDDVSSIQEPVGDLPTIIERQQKDWSSGEGMPPSISTGEQPSGIRGGDNSGEWRSWDGKIESDQRQRAIPLITWMLTVEFAARSGITGGRIPETIKVERRPLVTPSKKEIAETDKVQSEADAVKADAGLATREELRQWRYVEGEGGQLRLEDAEIGADAEPVDDGEG